MKARLKGTIVSAEKIHDGTTRIAFEANGKVDTKNINAQAMTLVGTIQLKSLIAAEMKIGAIITFDVSDEMEE